MSGFFLFGMLLVGSNAHEQEDPVKRIIICCDGTWNTPEVKEHGVTCATNVAKIAELVSQSDPAGIPQITYYHDGVGSGDLGDKIVGGAFGVGISKNIQDCYRFLVSNYLPGDEIWLFGFSRGAYTARSIIGLIRNSGLLMKSNLDRLSDAYDLYRDRSDRSHPNSGKARKFRAQFSLAEASVEIHFLGVWDTVGSLGVPGFILHNILDENWEFHDVALSSIVKNAYHAVAIDERREDFKPCLWAPSDGTKGEQIWFPGVHSDVGGGYTESALSDCALAWMMCKAESCGLYLDRNNVEVHPDPMGTLHNSMKAFFMARGESLREVGEETVSMSAVLRYGGDRREKPRGWPLQPRVDECANTCVRPERCF